MDTIGFLNWNPFQVQSSPDGLVALRLICRMTFGGLTLIVSSSASWFRGYQSPPTVSDNNSLCRPLAGKETFYMSFIVLDLNLYSLFSVINNSYGIKYDHLLLEKRIWIHILLH